MFRRIGIVFLMALLMAACAPQGVDEACCVVAEADSLWQAGQTYDDSLRLALAYETLSSFCSPLLSTLHPKRSTDYAHACYHYGRLLRRADDPVAAMQVFISGTHSGTDDHHILGRIYSNMGSICHFASEFQLSYDMFERSAHYFLENGDTLLYYYGLNNMAIELAEQEEKDSCNAIIDKILDHHITDSVLIAYCYLSKAEGFLKWKQYDSVIVWANQSIQYYSYLPSATLQLAQAYSQMGVKDSAVFYASQVVEKSTEPFDLNNALYILTHDDETKDKNEALETSADRSDVQKLLEIRQGHLSQAVQLLDQDLHRKLDWRWLYAILVTLVLGGLGIVSYLSKKRKQHKLLSQQIDDMKEMQSDAEERFEHTVEQHNQYQKNLKAQIEQSCALISQSENFPNNLLWKDYDKMCEIVNVNYGMLATKLQKEYALSQKEIRLCVLVLHRVQSGKQMSELLFYAESGIRNLKNRTAKKIGTNSINLRDYLIQIAAGEYPNTEI